MVNMDIASPTLPHHSQTARQPLNHFKSSCGRMGAVCGEWDVVLGHIYDLLWLAIIIFL